MTKHLLFLDVETTGLDPGRDDLLEVGCILTTDAPALEERWRFDIRIAHDWARWGVRPNVHPAVEAMHTASGLWDALHWTNGVWGCAAVESAILRKIQGLGVKRGDAMLAGFSVHFDREVLRVRMPILHRYLSHRVIDVSTVRHLYWATRGERPAQEAAHRALADCDQALAELRRYLPALATD